MDGDQPFGKKAAAHIHTDDSHNLRANEMVAVGTQATIALGSPQPTQGYLKTKRKNRKNRTKLNMATPKNTPTITLGGSNDGADNGDPQALEIPPGLRIVTRENVPYRVTYNASVARYGVVTKASDYDVYYDAGEPLTFTHSGISHTMHAGSAVSSVRGPNMMQVTGNVDSSFNDASMSYRSSSSSSAMNFVFF